MSSILLKYFWNVWNWINIILNLKPHLTRNIWRFFCRLELLTDMLRITQAYWLFLKAACRGPFTQSECDCKSDIFLKPCLHIAFACASASTFASTFCIELMVTQTHTQRMGSKPFSASTIDSIQMLSLLTDWLLCAIRFCGHFCVFHTINSEWNPHKALFTLNMCVCVNSNIVLMVMQTLTQRMSLKPFFACAFASPLAQC